MILVQLMFCAFVLFVASCSAMGAPSGLNVIPTADIIEAGAVSLEAESTGNGRPWGSDCESCWLFQMGLGKGVELGVDWSRSSGDYWINVKWQVRAESDRQAGLALGIQGLSHKERAQPYAAAIKSLAQTRLHAGAILLDGRIRWMFGLECPVCSWVSFQADYITRQEQSATFGLAIALTDRLSLTVAKSVGNSRGTRIRHVLNCAWSLR